MGKRRKKSKEQLISELLKHKSNEKKVINGYDNRSPIYERNQQKIDNKNKKNKTNIFLTNLSMKLTDDVKYKISSV